MFAEDQRAVGKGRKSLANLIFEMISTEIDHLISIK